MREERERVVCCLRVSVWRAARRYDNTGRQAEWAAGTVGEECGMCGSGSVEEDNNRGRSAFFEESSACVWRERIRRNYVDRVYVLSRSDPVCECVTVSL